MRDDCFYILVDLMIIKLSLHKWSIFRDIKGHDENDPDYDPRTVHLPESFLKQQTPVSKFK